MSSTLGVALSPPPFIGRLGIPLSLFSLTWSRYRPGDQRITRPENYEEEIAAVEFIIGIVAKFGN